MAAKRHERTRARRAALQVLYTSEITDESPAAIAEDGGRFPDEEALPEYALLLVRGVEAHRCAIDGHLSATSENWSLARMPIVDRSILRLATYEMMYVDDVPTSVTINEAVELAKDFGGEDESPRFVNGVLGRIAKRLDEGDGDLSPRGVDAASADAASADAASTDAVLAPVAPDAAAPVCAEAAGSPEVSHAQ